MAVHTIFVVVVVSFGWFFCLAFCLLAMWHFLTKRHEKKEREMKEAGIIRHDEHVRVKENIVKGPKGTEAIALSIEKDEKFEEDMSKKERELRGKNMHCRDGDVDLEKGASSASN